MTYKQYCPSTYQNITWPRKREKRWHSLHKDGPWEHDARWEKQTQRDTQDVTPLTGNIQNRPIHRHRLGFMAVRGWGNDYSWERGFLWNLIVNLIAQLLNMLETIGLHTSKCLILWYVNFTSIFKMGIRNSVVLAGTIQLSKHRKDGYLLAWKYSQYYH